MKTDTRIFKDSKALGHAAAEIFVKTASQAIAARGRFLVALSGGSTPSRLYRLLTSEPYLNNIEWGKTFIFWGDERCVSPDDAGSNYHQAHDALLKHMSIPIENILRVKGELDPVEAADDYARTLKKFSNSGLDWPRLDLVLLGMGEDGHTASLFPGSNVDSSTPTLAVTAHYQGRPANRVTLTPLVFNSARSILFLVTGENKASTLAKVLKGAYKPNPLPAQRIRPNEGEVIWLVDDAAGSKL